ncbi:MAG: SCO family protein [Xanthomonadales bacterium]|nr:SCO family protein [Xanthomonadales bacterium]MCP5475900.1 SCO family protein [Rhodanobacteraceae bacterium]
MSVMQHLERKLPWIIVALAAIAGIAGFVASKQMFDGREPAPEAVLQLQGSLLYPQPKPLPEFMLESADGRSLSNKDWQGRWRLVFFGFTHCPDVCPTTLATTKAALAKLKSERPDADIAVSFVSIDPERDLPQQLAAYVAFFDPAFEAATGSQEQLLALTRAVGVIYAKVATGSGPQDYTMDHSASLLIVDPQARLVGLMRPPHQAEVMAADLATLIDRQEH